MLLFVYGRCLDDAGLLCPLHDLGDVAEGESGDSVGASVVDGYAACLGVVQFCAGEADVGHVAGELIDLAGCNEVWAAAIDGLPGLLKVEQGRAEAVDVAIAGAEHAVVEQQPAFAGLDGDGAGANLHALPGAHLEGCGSHDVAVLAPEAHVGRLAVEDITERCVARIGRTGEHGEVAAYLFGEEHAVAVVGEEGVLKLMEGLEVLGPGYADGGSVVAVAPGDVVLVLDLADAGIVAVDPLSYFLVVAFEAQGFRVDVPLLAVGREAYVEHHAAVGVVAAEDAGEAFAEGHYGTVEDAIACGQEVARDDGVLATAPHHVLAAFGAVLPRNVGQGLPLNFQFTHSSVWFYKVLFFVGIGERHEPRDEQCRDGAEEHEDEEVAVAECVADKSAEHAGKHDAEVHDARCEGVVCHLVFAGSYLLHHEECEADEAESVAEVLEHDTAADEPQAFGLIDGEEGVGYEREVEHDGQREERLLQSAVCDVVACEYGTDDEGGCSERAVAQSDFLLGESEALAGARGFEEEGHDLHDEAFGEAVEDDEEDIIYNVFFLEELHEDAEQLLEHFLDVLLSVLALAGGGQDEVVVYAEGDHDAAYDEHDDHPCGDGALVLCGGCSGCVESFDVAGEVLDERSGEVDEASGSCDLGDVVEGALPSYPLCLLFVGEHAHVGAVGCDVVRGTAHGDDGEHGDADGEEGGQVQGEGDESEHDAGDELGGHDEEFLGLVHLEEGAPQGLQGPWQHDERSPEGYLGVADVESFVHECANHVEHDEGHAHGEVERGHPGYGAQVPLGGFSDLFGFFHSYDLLVFISL